MPRSANTPGVRDAPSNYSEWDLWDTWDLSGIRRMRRTRPTSPIGSLLHKRASGSGVPTASASQARQRSTVPTASPSLPCRAVVPRPREKAEARQALRDLRFARGFRANRMQTAPETSKKTVEFPSGLDFVREIEMWCSLCLVFGTVNVIHPIIDFAETKSVR